MVLTIFLKSLYFTIIYALGVSCIEFMPAGHIYLHYSHVNINIDVDFLEWVSVSMLTICLHSCVALILYFPTKCVYVQNSSLLTIYEMFHTLLLYMLVFSIYCDCKSYHIWIMFWRACKSYDPFSTSYLPMCSSTTGITHIMCIIF